nr:hypothetical protein [uncultured bacterium]
MLKPRLSNKVFVLLMLFCIASQPSWAGKKRKKSNDVAKAEVAALEQRNVEVEEDTLVASDKKRLAEDSTTESDTPGEEAIGVREYEWNELKALIQFKQAEDPGQFTDRLFRLSQLLTKENFQEESDEGSQDKTRWQAWITVSNPDNSESREYLHLDLREGPFQSELTSESELKRISNQNGDQKYFYLTLTE